MDGKRLLPYVLFLVSGASALVLEVMGLEMLARVFGSTAEATATTLATFFLGLGLGAWVGGRVAGRTRRPLRTYGLLELGVAAGALLLLVLVPLESWLYGALFAETSGGIRALGRVVLAFFVFAPATIAMGATFPLLAEHVVRRGATLGRGGALLYAMNTLGAAAGAALAGFVLPPWIGIRATVLVAAGASLLAGLVAVLASERETRAMPSSVVAPGIVLEPRVLALVSGLGMMALQVLYVRAFSLAVPASIHVFALVLVTWLLGLSLGGVWARSLARGRRDPRRVLVILLAAGATWVAVSPTLLSLATD
jgi:spermidine synthase